MMNHSQLKKCVGAGIAGILTLTVGNAEDLLVATDPIIPIDEDIASNSSSPGAEGPENVLDGNSDSKYLNFGRLRSGFIVTPSGGASALGSMTLTTANDAVERDPTNFEIYGTNEAILSVNHSEGQGESWTLLAMGDLSLSDERFVTSNVIPLGVDLPYTSFKVIFPDVKGVGNSMQIADVNFFVSDDGTGTSFLVTGSPIIAIQESVAESSSPGGEEVTNLIDGDTATKYLNFGRENSGFIVTPAAGPSLVRAFTIGTANDAEGRDPVDWELFGTNEVVTTQAHQTGLGREAWTTIASGTLDLPLDRFTVGEQVLFANDASYTSYKWICRSVRGPVGGVVDSMQMSEFQFICDPTLNQLPLEVQKLTFLPNGTQIQLDWTGSGGSTHLLQFSTDLVDWSFEVDDSLDPDVHNPYIVNIAELPDSPKGFFRFVKVEP